MSVKITLEFENIQAATLALVGMAGGRVVSPDELNAIDKTAPPLDPSAGAPPAANDPINPEKPTQPAEASEFPEGDPRNTAVIDLGLSARATNGIQRAGVHTVGALIQNSASQILKFDGVGDKAVEQIVEKLTALELELAEESPIQAAKEAAASQDTPPATTVETEDTEVTPRSALAECISAHGVAKAQAILKSFGAARVSEVPAEQAVDFILACASGEVPA